MITNMFGNDTSNVGSDDSSVQELSGGFALHDGNGFNIAAYKAQLQPKVRAHK